MAILLIFSQVYGESFSVETPSSVKEDSPFAIYVSVENKNDKIKINGKHFQLLGRTGISIQKKLVNGRFYENTVYTYKLKSLPAPKAGKTMDILLTVEVGGEKKEIKIAVTEVKQKKPSRDPQPNNFSLPLSDPSFNDSVLIRNHLSKKKLLVNEIATMETIIYSDSAIDSGNLVKKYQQSCYQLIPIRKFKSRRKPETINNKRYLSSVISKYIIYSPKKGECIIEGMPFRITLIQPGFFFKKKTLDVESIPVEITVDEYPPEQPDGFLSHFGDYQLHLILSTINPKVNTPVGLMVMVSGEGNFITLNQPEVSPSPHLTLIKDRVIDNYSVNRNTLVGKKNYFYYLTPLKVGLISDTPTITFSYFSPTSKSYHVIQKKVPELQVLAQDNSTPSHNNKTAEKIQLHPPYTDPLPHPTEGESTIEAMGAGGWYHLIGTLGVLTFWIRKRMHLRPSSSSSAFRKLRKKITALDASVSQSYDQNFQDYRKKFPWIKLKGLVWEWIKAIYGSSNDLKTEKSWLKQIDNLISSSKLSKKEVEILKKLKKNIQDFEVALYSPKKPAPTDFKQGVDRIHTLLEKILQAHSQKLSKKSDKKPKNTIASKSLNQRL